MAFPDWAVYVLIIFGGYLVGSFPTGWVLGKIFKRIDIREYGSGNTGFSNVYRVLGSFPSVLAIFGDIVIKGYLLALAVRMVIGYVVIDTPQKFYSLGYTELVPQIIIVIAGLMSVVGHNWPVWLKLKGGKGMATTAGVFICFVPLSCLVLAVVWFVVVFTTRYTSLSNIITTPAVPIFIFLEMFFIMGIRNYWYPLTIGGFIAGIMILFSHRENIKRLFAGTERKFGDKSERLPSNSEN